MKTKIILFSFALLVPFFGIASDYQDFQNELYKKYSSNENINTYIASKSFCEEVIKHEKFDSKFEPKKSLFLQVLCEKTGISDGGGFYSKLQLKSKGTKFYEKLISDASKNSGSGIFGQCKKEDGYNTDKDSLNNVSMSCVAKDIFNKLANDYLNVGTYFAYGGFRGKDNMKKFEKDFYLGGICPDSYIKDEGTDAEYCKHPKTYKYYKNLVSGLNSGLRQLALIETDGSRVYDDFTPDDIGSEDVKYLLTTKDMIYNELYFYSVFIGYYSTMIDLNTGKFQLKSPKPKSVSSNTKSESITARNDLTVARYSVKKSFSMVKDIYRTFPMHLGYMTLKEDIGKLRESFARLYTPMDQFRYKLQNVQDEDKF